MAVFVADGWVVVVLVEVLVEGGLVDGTVEVDGERDGGFVVEALGGCGVVVEVLDGREVAPDGFVVGDDPAARELYEGAAEFYERFAEDFANDKKDAAALAAFLNKTAS